jgi:hypothetical protein
VLFNVIIRGLSWTWDTFGYIMSLVGRADRPSV